MDSSEKNMVGKFSIREILKAFLEAGSRSAFPGSSRTIREVSHVCHSHAIPIGGGEGAVDTNDWCINAKLICAFVFAYAKHWFSHDAAHTCMLISTYVVHMHKASFLMIKHMSRVMRKPTICICENKEADQLRGNHEADQRLCFRYTDSTIPLLPKSKISSL